MKKIPNSSRRLREHILRALNKIRKPSTAAEITDLLNRNLELEDQTGMDGSGSSSGEDC